MKWLKGDVISAFADVPDMRIRAEQYTKLAKQRDQWLQDLHDFSLETYDDIDAFNHISRRVGSCASQIIWGAGSEGKPERLIWGNFCENNWCPICAQKKSVRLGRVLNEMMEKLSDDGYQFLHLVLSDRNCTLDNLSDTIKLYNNSWERLKNSTFRGRYDGFFVSLEYTLQWHGRAELHPHFHVLLACSPDKWTSGDTYIAHEELVKKWRRSLQIDKRYPGEGYDPQVYIYQVQRGDSSLFLELTKYLFDFGNYSNFIREHPFSVPFGIIYQATKQKKLHRGGGVLALSHKNLYFVQLQQAPEYVPTYCIITGRHRSLLQYNVKFAVKLDDSVPITLDDTTAPVKSFLKTYIKHQAYFYGFGYKSGDQIHLPDWWEDLSISPPVRSRAPSRASPTFGTFDVPDLQQISVFDLCI